MKVAYVKTMLLLLALQLLAGAVLFAQGWNRPLVKKFEAGIPGYSRMANIWPKADGYWGAIHKIDSLQGKYYYGIDVVNIDSMFEITFRKNYGDTLKYYLDQLAPQMSMPDLTGNFWYWIAGYTRSDSSWHQYYGKIQANGDTLFQHEIPNITPYDYFYEFLQIPTGGGVLLNTHESGNEMLTWLTWIDEQGNISHLDSTVAINTDYQHGTDYCTIDQARDRIIAPSLDYYLGAYQSWNLRPMVRFYDYAGDFLGKIDLTTQLKGNDLGTIYATQDGGYVGRIIKVIPDTTKLYEDRQAGIVKFDSSFNVLWTKYLFPPRLANEAVTFHKMQDGSFLLAGRHDRSLQDGVMLLDWFITKFSPDLDSMWTRFYTLGGDSSHYIVQDPTQILIQDDGSILVLVDNSGGDIYYSTLYRLDSMGCLIGGCSFGDTTHVPPDTVPWQKPRFLTEGPPPNGELLAFPNPSNGLWSLVWDVEPGDRSRLRVLDVAGKLLLEDELLRELRPSKLDLRDWAAGVYLVEVTSSMGRVFRTRLVLVH